MGTLHEVYQLKPRVIADGAILIVKKDMETAFLEKFPSDKPKELDASISRNIFIKKSEDGKVQRYSIYAGERIIDFKNPGVYIVIQSGSKYGFNSPFVDGIKNIAPYLEDSLFYVIWDHLISRFEIKNGVYSLQEAKNFNEWDYRFDEYLISNYLESPQLIANFLLDQIVEMKVWHDEMVKDGDDPRTFYETEDYEELLHKIQGYKKNIPIEEMKGLEAWLQEKITLQRAWEDEYYG